MSFIAAPRNVDTPADAVYRLRRSIAQWQDQFDIVLLDTPPMLTTNDATDLLAAADAVVLVLRAGQTRTGPAERVANVLTRFRADVLGIILNGCDNADMDPYYAYGYGYGYTGKKSKGGPGSGVFSPSAHHDPEYVPAEHRQRERQRHHDDWSVFDGDGGAGAGRHRRPRPTDPVAAPPAWGFDDLAPSSARCSRTASPVALHARAPYCPTTLGAGSSSPVGGTASKACSWPPWSTVPCSSTMRNAARWRRSS